jgi:hypothetical protein
VIAVQADEQAEDFGAVETESRGGRGRHVARLPGLANDSLDVLGAGLQRHGGRIRRLAGSRP